jgi:hypothetical protein
MCMLCAETAVLGASIAAVGIPFLRRAWRWLTCRRKANAATC